MTCKKLWPAVSLTLLPRLVLAASPTGLLELTPDRAPPPDSVVASGRQSGMGSGVADLGEQTRNAYNALFLEVRGPALFLSINYDRIFAEHLSVRIGLGLFRFEEVFVPVFPVGVNYLLGNGDHKLEVGLTVTLWSPLAWIYGRPLAWISPGVGYRFAPKALAPPSDLR